MASSSNQADTSKPYSEPGQGTTMKMYLPRLPVDRKIAGEIASDRDRYPKRPPARTEMILVVEDEPDVRVSTAGMIEELGLLRAHGGGWTCGTAAARRSSGDERLLFYRCRPARRL